jgi:hypothetical protein
MPPKKMDVTITLTVAHVDGPKFDAERVADAAVEAIVGETLELLTHDAFPVRSRYRVEDGELYA